MSAEIAARLADARSYLGFSTAYVAAATGMTATALEAVESGRRAPDELELQRLSRAYGYPVRWFLGHDDTVPEETVQLLARMVDALTSEDRAEALRFAAYLRYDAEPER